MRVFRTRGLVWPFLFAFLLLTVWLTSSAGVVEEVSAEELVPQVSFSSPIVTKYRTIEIELNSDDAGQYYLNCNYGSDYNFHEIYFGHCGSNAIEIISGFRFDTEALSDIDMDTITDMYIVFSVEKAYSNAMPPLRISAHKVANSLTFSGGNYPEDRINQLTTANVIWNLEAWDSTLPNSRYDQSRVLGSVRTPSLMPVLEEMNSLSNWTLGNPLTFIIQPNASSLLTPPISDVDIPLLSRRVMAREHPYNTAHARLVVEYEGSAIIANSYYLRNLTDEHLDTVACQLADSLKTSETHSAIVTIVVGKPSSERLNELLINESFPRTYVTYAEFGIQMRKFITSYGLCAIEKGVDTKVTMAIASQNYGSNINFTTGNLWSSVVSILRISTKHGPFNQLVDVVIASDLETGWNTPEATLAWLDGAVSHYTSPFINVAAVGFPDMGLSVPVDLNVERAKTFTTGEGYTWTIGEVLEMTYSQNPRIYSLPQIYLRNGANANQWYYLAILASELGDAPLFEGILTQYGACQQKLTTSYSCPTGLFGTDNTPYQAWEQLMTLNSNHPNYPNKLTVKYFTDICNSVEGLDHCGFSNLNQNP